MSRSDKTAYTAKQKRQAKHIEESELDQGRSQEEAERIAWATVNKQDGGGLKKKHK
ncbi:hypothetical protein ACINWC323_2569 [Acinetobacter sp. WC-323]|uniref:hypothetical protein n=1 Tax=Acinetobacter sp. WC-323 TaxID=903918 RepID=UPI00029DD3BF|nr:hypothetical protein [Acinetobacter sp. WC-323]EKU56596.1 hypothetical protein ACINWC323_2569 [Acinetobacter sp. WC-323]